MKFKITLLTLIIAATCAPLCASDKKPSRLAAARARLFAHRGQKAPEVPHAERQEAAPTMLDVVAAVEDEDAFIKTLRAHLEGNPGCKTWDENCAGSCPTWDSSHSTKEPGYDRPLSCKSLLGSCYQNLRGCSSKNLDEELKKVLRDWNSPRFPRSRCLVAALVCQGANPNSVLNTDNMTLLTKAVLYEDYTLSKFLLEKGADANLPGWGKESPLEYARTAPMAKLLLENNATLDDHALLRTMGYHGDENGELTEFYIEHGAHVNTKNSWGHTPLHRLSLRCDDVLHKQDIILKKADLLLRAGAEPHHRITGGGWTGSSALDIARSKQKHAPCRALADFLNEWEKQPTRIME